MYLFKFLQQMSGRTFVLILFFWAVLTMVTPTLVRWSASAKPHIEFKAKGETREEMYTKRVLELLPRRALVPTMLQKAPLAPSPAPAPAPAPQSFLESKFLQISAPS